MRTATLDGGTTSCLSQGNGNAGSNFSHPLWTSTGQIFVEGVGPTVVMFPSLGRGIEHFADLTRRLVLAAACRDQAAHVAATETGELTRAVLRGHSPGSISLKRRAVAMTPRSASRPRRRARSPEVRRSRASSRPRGRAESRAGCSSDRSSRRAPPGRTPGSPPRPV
jgi:hypothetical protein